MNDQKLLNKGLALLPDLYESCVEAERTVAIGKDGQGAVCVGPAENYRTRRDGRRKDLKLQYVTGE